MSLNSITIGNVGVTFTDSNTSNTIIQTAAAVTGNITTGDSAFLLTGNVVTGNFTLPAGKNAGTFGPVTVAANVTVTAPTGQTWTVV